MVADGMRGGLWRSFHRLNRNMTTCTELMAATEVPVPLSLDVAANTSPSAEIRIRLVFG